MTDTVAVAPTDIVESGAATPSRAHQIVRACGWALIWLSALTLGFVVHQLWITTWLAQLNQSELDTEREAHFASAVISEVEYIPLAPVVVAGATNEGGPATPVSPGATGSTLDSGDAPRPILRVESAPELRSSFALIRIPALDRLADGWNVVEGVRTSDLQTGAGHVPWTALPGQPGNAVISGHRTSYGAPFRDLDQLVIGDQIEVDTALGTHIYEVRETTVVKPTDAWVLSDRGGAWLTLTTCHPVLSARQRLVIFAELVAGPNATAIASSR